MCLPELIGFMYTKFKMVQTLSWLIYYLVSLCDNLMIQAYFVSTLLWPLFESFDWLTSRQKKSFHIDLKGKKYDTNDLSSHIDIYVLCLSQIEVCLHEVSKDFWKLFRFSIVKLLREEQFEIVGFYSRYYCPFKTCSGLQTANECINQRNIHCLDECGRKRCFGCNKNLGLVCKFRPCSAGHFLTTNPWTVCLPGVDLCQSMPTTIYSVNGTK